MKSLATAVLDPQGTGNLLHLITNYHRWTPVSSGIFDHLDIPSVINLNKTCKALSHSFEYYRYHNATSTWDINRRLKVFVKDPITFRRLVAEQGGLISGKFALEFFKPISDGVGAIAIWLHTPEALSPKAKAIISWLIESEAYESRGEQVHGEEYGETRATHAVVRRKELLSICLMETRSPVLQSYLTIVGSTHLSNFITAGFAYSLYAKCTLVDVRYHAFHVGRDNTGRLIFNPTEDNRESLPEVLRRDVRSDVEKYGRWGWKYATEEDFEEKENPIRTWGIDGFRAVRDDRVLILPLDTTGVLDEGLDPAEIDKEIRLGTWTVMKTYSPTFIQQFSISATNT